MSAPDRHPFASKSFCSRPESFVAREGLTEFPPGLLGRLLKLRRRLYRKHRNTSNKRVARLRKRRNCPSHKEKK